MVLAGVRGTGLQGRVVGKWERGFRMKPAQQLPEEACPPQALRRGLPGTWKGLCHWLLN